MEGDKVHLHPSRDSLHGGNSAIVSEDFGGEEGLETLKMSFVQAIVKPEINGEEDELDVSLTRPAKKRRLTSNQLQFLEGNFAVENKLEPERKLQLAKELGLQPRQVAIWFQNRRARFKNKQLEKDYDSLKCSFKKLKADFESLVKEKESLEYEVSSLKEKLADDREKGMVPLESHYDQSTIPRAGEGEMACKLPVLISSAPKQEDASSAKSDVFDSDSPLSFLGPDQSDHFSHDEEDHHFSCFLSSSLPICQDPSHDSCNYDIPVEDQPFWSTYGGMYY